jgi:hypothetical protein
MMLQRLVFVALVSAALSARAGDPGPAEVAAAREQAKWMHRAHAAALEAMHHHYFRRENPVLPARAMMDVFAKIERETRVKARWISVNAKAMSVEHEPRSEFDKKAAAALAAGKDFFEHIEGGVYHRAGPIPLGGSCIICHAPPTFTGKGQPGPFFAGLVISIPLLKE